MSDVGTTVEGYIKQVPEDRRAAFEQLRQAILNHLPNGFVETISYGMIGYVVPHSIYPKGYHCKPNQALPFINIAAQKNFIAVYHMGIYANPDLLQWFVDEFPKHTSAKLDMGKSCIRFKNLNDIPYDLIGELATKMTVNDCIEFYESNFKKK